MISADRVRHLFSYDPMTGILTWQRQQRAAFSGQIAGSLGMNGYLRVGVDGGQYPLHRIIFLHYHGRMPEAEIDHVDGNPLNNAIANLREATRSQNQANTKYSHGSSGVRGVSWHAKSRKWQAQIVVRRRFIYLGLFSDKKAAGAAYEEAAAKYFSEFAHSARNQA